MMSGQELLLPESDPLIKNMISGAAQADVALLMVPADGNFTTAIQKGNHKAHGCTARGGRGATGAGEG